MYDPDVQKVQKAGFRSFRTQSEFGEDHMRTALSSSVTQLHFKVLWTVMAVLLLLFPCLCSVAFAGGNADGRDGDYEYDPDPGQLLESVTVVMQDGGTYDIGTYKEATWLVCNSSGTYTVTGKSTNTLLRVNASAGMDAVIIFDNARLVATKDCPGASANARSAIEINGSAGSVTLRSAPGSRNYFRAKGGRPCIRKDNTGVRLVFDTVNENNPGLLEVHADPDAHCTSAIGCYGSLSVHNTFGNCVFLSGQIQAYGSAGSFAGSVLYGGAAIGADEYSAVDKITFERADVYAEAGSASAAGIGTSSCYLFTILSEYDRAPQPCRNIVINGGKVYATHMSGSENSNVYGGAGIGGGWGGSCDHITVNGGDVTALGSMGAAGIGGGQDGDAVDIVISGGSVYAQGGSTGIGGGEAYGYVCSHDDLRYGDCQLTINGGDITAIGGISFSGTTCPGVGIGGWKEKFYYMSNRIAGRMNITINGGTVRADGNGAAAIGSGAYGNCSNITVNGGVIRVHSTNSAVDIGGYGDTVCTCENITITGGTVTNTEKGKAVMIGGGNPDKWNSKPDSKHTNVYISGGNVFASIYGEDHAMVSSSDGTQVYRYDLGLGDFALSTARTDDRNAVVSLNTEPALKYTYGLTDTYLIPSSITYDPMMFAWLPADRESGNLSTDPAFLNYTYDMRREAVNFFSGNIGQEDNRILYPRLWFLFDDNYLDGDLNRDSASWYIGQRQTETIHNSSSGSAIPQFYSLDQEGKVPLLKADGTYYPDVSDPSGRGIWTDSQGKMVFDPGTLQNYYVNGIRLYSVWPSFDLKFIGNRPDGTAMPMSGSTDDITDINPAVGTVIPSCGFDLKNYSFTGWNTKADGSGTVYRPGDTATDLRPVTGRVAYLYAQWEPKEYSLTYDPGDGTGTRTSLMYAVDRTGTLADPSDLGFIKPGCVFLGWTIGAFGNLHAAGREFVNMCDFDENWVLHEKTLTARWMPEKSVAVTVMLNGERVSLSSPETEIILNQNGTRFAGFEEDPVTGAYILESNARGSLPPGLFVLEIAGFDTDGITVNMDENSSVSLILQYYTVTVTPSGHIAGSSVYNSAGEAFSSVNALQGSKRKIVSEPETGYAFHRYTVSGVMPGWESGPETAVQSIRVNGRVTLTASAVPCNYTVLYDANGGDGSMPGQPAVYGEAFRLYSAAFTRKGYVFSGWNTAADGSGTAYADGDTVKNLTVEHKGTVVLYAVWTPIRYAVTYDLRGGAYPAGRSNPAYYTAESEFTLVAPEMSAYTFLGWTGTGFPLPTVTVKIPKGSTGDRFYSARWKRACYSVTFEMSGHGLAPDGQTVESGGNAERPPDPVETGWIFGGWYTDTSYAQAFSFSTPITKDTVIYAKWTGEAPLTYTVSFIMGGHGKQIPPQIVEDGGTVLRPDDPSENKWRFRGWHADPAFRHSFDFDAPVHADTLIYARWTAVPPKTGDNGHLLLWITLLTGGVSAAWITICAKKKNASRR